MYDFRVNDKSHVDAICLFYFFVFPLPRFRAVPLKRLIPLGIKGAPPMSSNIGRGRELEGPDAAACWRAEWRGLTPGMIAAELSGRGADLDDEDGDGLGWEEGKYSEGEVRVGKVTWDSVSSSWPISSACDSFSQLVSDSITCRSRSWPGSFQGSSATLGS